MEFSNAFYDQAADNPKILQDASFLTDEIQKLTKENRQLKQDSCAKDFDYVAIIEQLDGKENEIEELRAELNQLSEQIALSNAKEEEYLNSARSCVSMEKQIQMLQKRLADHRRDFEQLSTVHAACPTPEELESAVEETKASYRRQVTEVQDQLSERDRQITALEERIARKDLELQKLSSDLIQSQTDFNITQQHCGNLKQRVVETEHLIQDRERLIGNMKILMARKSVKINLLLLRIRELEIKLQMCMQELRETRSSTPECYDIEGIESLRKSWSQDTVQRSSQDRINHHHHYDMGGVGAGDATRLWEELSTIQSTVATATGTAAGEVDGLLCKINNIKNKIHRKLEKEIMRDMKLRRWLQKRRMCQKRVLRYSPTKFSSTHHAGPGEPGETEMAELISSTRRHFGQTQKVIEKMMTHPDDSNETRDFIRGHLTGEMKLNRILESSENQKQAISARIQSFSKALKNLEVLEEFLRKSRI